MTNSEKELSRQFKHDGSFQRSRAYVSSTKEYGVPAWSIRHREGYVFPGDFGYELRWDVSNPEAYKSKLFIAHNNDFKGALENLKEFAESNFEERAPIGAYANPFFNN